MKKVCLAETAEWLEARKKGIGGSDAAAALARSKYKTQYNLFLEKVGIAEPEEPSAEARARMDKGKALEPHLREMMLEILSKEIPKFKIKESRYLMKHDEKDYLLASLDGTFEDQEGVGIIELKTSRCNPKAYMANWGYGKYPTAYLLQVLHYMNVTGYTRAILFSRIEKTNFEDEIEEVIYRVDRIYEEKELQEWMLKELEIFWEVVKRGDEGEALNKLSCKKYIEKLIKK